MAPYLFDQRRPAVQKILDTRARRVSGIASVTPVLMDDGYLTLRFEDGSFKTPFVDRYVKAPSRCLPIWCCCTTPSRIRYCA